MPSTRMWLLIGLVVLLTAAYVLFVFVPLQTAPTSGPGPVDGPLSETVEDDPESAVPH